MTRRKGTLPMRSDKWYVRYGKEYEGFRTKAAATRFARGSRAYGFKKVKVRRYRK